MCKNSYSVYFAFVFSSNYMIFQMIFSVKVSWLYPLHKQNYVFMSLNMEFLLLDIVGHMSKQAMLIIWIPHASAVYDNNNEISILIFISDNNDHFW